MTSTTPSLKLTITPAILRLVAGLDEFKGQWLALGNLPAEQLATLERQALVKAVAAGMRLAGVNLTDTEAESMLGDLADAAETNGRQDNGAAAHAKVLNLLATSSQSIPFTQHLIKQLHRVLHLPGGAALRGQYREEDAEGIARRMHQLVTWTSDTLAADLLHPVLVIAIFLLRFLAIRPFAEDNQRLSRILALLLLLKNGYGFVRYHALAQSFEEQQSMYDQGLTVGLDTLRQQNRIAEEWLVAFLEILHHHNAQIRVAVSRAQHCRQRPRLEQQILDLAREQGQATNKSIQDATAANRNTIKLHLRRLVANGELTQHGRGKGTRYTLGG